MSGNQPAAPPRIASSRAMRGRSAVSTALLAALIVAASLTTIVFAVIGG
jgi:hypothetical protein